MADPALKLSGQKLLGILPQRYPLLMVDRVTELNPGSSIQGYKLVGNGEFWCSGHFPERPVMPGILILEALSQLGTVLAHATKPFDRRSSRLFIMGFDKAKFRHLVVPGDRLDLSVELVQLALEAELHVLGPPFELFDLFLEEHLVARLEV